MRSVLVCLVLPLALSACGDPGDDASGADFAQGGDPRLQDGVGLGLKGPGGRLSGNHAGGWKRPGGGSTGGSSGGAAGTGGAAEGAGGGAGTAGSDAGSGGAPSGGSGGATTGGSGGATTGGSGGATAGGSGGATAGGSGGATAGGTGGGTAGGTGSGEFAASCMPTAPQGNVYWVATTGNDGSGDGSVNNPWRTIGAAVDLISDGGTILVKPGEYAGQTKINRRFTQGITIRSEQPYRARLRNNGTVVQCFYGQGIAMEGFDIAHSGPGAGALVVQIQDVDGDGGCSRITLRNNVLHDSYNNDILKINNAATQVLVEHNIFYNQSGSDEHIDINSVEDVTIRHNIFFNDFAGSGRSNQHNTSSFVVVKDSNDGDDRFLGSRRVSIEGNVFLHFEGSSGAPYLLLGEDGKPYYEARDITIENNLMLGDNTDSVRAAFGCKGVADVLFRNNTISGNLPASAFAMRLNTEGQNQPNNNIQFFNNIWSDPTGTMGPFSTTPSGQTSACTLLNNVYWNDGEPLPASSSNLVNIADDTSAVVGDPSLAAPSSVDLPRWDSASGVFGDGSASTCEAFQSLVESFGATTGNGAGVDAADPARASAVDILGRARDASPDIGAWEQ